MATLINSSDYSREVHKQTFRKKRPYLYFLDPGDSLTGEPIYQVTTQEVETRVYTWRTYRTAANELSAISAQNPEGLDTDDWRMTADEVLPHGARYGTYTETWETTTESTADEGTYS